VERADPATVDPVRRRRHARLFYPGCRLRWCAPPTVIFTNGYDGTIADMYFASPSRLSQPRVVYHNPDHKSVIALRRMWALLPIAAAALDRRRCRPSLRCPCNGRKPPAPG
jgi:hypothetical protein